MPPDYSLKDYIGRGEEQVVAAPYEAHGVRFFGFFVRADLARLNEIVQSDLYRAGVLPFSIRIPYVLVYYADIAYLSSATVRDRLLGGSSEQELAITMFVELDSEPSDHLYAYFPYMFVDNPAAMAAGREVYGFPKQMASMRFDDGKLIVDRTYREGRQDDMRAPPRRLLDIQLPDDMHDEADRNRRIAGINDWRGFDDVRGALTRLLDQVQRVQGFAPGEAQTQAILRIVSSGAISMIFLKQFRDAVDPTKACYQAIVEAESRVTDFRRGGTLGEGFAIDVPRPIRDHLGLARGPIMPVHSFYLDFDFRIEAGRTLWSAP